jgi:Homeodomain-like domain
MAKQLGSVRRITAAQRRDRSDIVLQRFKAGKTRAEISRDLGMSYQTVCRIISRRKIGNGLEGWENGAGSNLPRYQINSQNEPYVLERLLNAYEEQSRRPRENGQADKSFSRVHVDDVRSQIKEMISLLKRWEIKSPDAGNAYFAHLKESDKRNNGRSEALTAWLERVRAGNAIIERADSLLRLFAEAGISLDAYSLPEIVRDLRQKTTTTPIAPARRSAAKGK